MLKRRRQSGGFLYPQVNSLASLHLRNHKYTPFAIWPYSLTRDCSTASLSSATMEDKKHVNMARVSLKARYIKNMDASYMLSLAGTAAFYEVPLLRDAIWKHYDREYRGMESIIMK
jgi:hypothetical protein